jgi:DNA-binding XRE family transcriptional regulator
VAAYLLRLDAGLTAKQAGRLLGRSDQTVFDLTKHARAALANRDTVADVIELVRRALVTVEATQPTVSVSPSPRRQPYPLPHLARWRTFAGWTQAHLAKHSGIALTTIVRLERGRRAQLESVRLLADALLVAPSVLTGATVLDSLTGEAYRQCRDCGASRLSGG